MVRRFEEAMAARYGMRHCIAVNSCTAALHLALLSHGIGPGDEVIVPALTFVSTALAVVYCGATPVFADVNPGTLCMGLGRAAEAVTPKTKAIIPVDYAGYPAENYREPFPIPVIQDAAHSAGGLAYGDSVCLSFHPVKPLATGDGGAILLNDDARAERLRALRWCGIDRSTWKRSGKRYTWDYDIAEVGYKCHWNDIQAAIGLAQLERLDAMQARRGDVAFTYYMELRGMGDVQLPPRHQSHTWHLYPIRVPAERRDALLDHLAERGISAGVHYKPLTYYPMFAEQPTPPVTEREWRRLVSLPIYADMTDGEQDRVIEAVKEFFR
jgi:perosamine synthetase